MFNFFKSKEKGFGDIKDPSMAYVGRNYRSPEYTDLEALKTYEKSPWIFAALYRVASDIALTRWTVLKMGPKAPSAARNKRVWKDGFKYKNNFETIELNASNRIQSNNVEEIEHPILDLLDRPNPVQNGWEFMYSVLCHLELSGDAFLKIYRNERGQPVELYAIPPHRMQITPTKDKPVYSASVGDGHIKEIPESEVIWIKRPRPQDPIGRGTSPVKSLAHEIDLDKEVIDHTLSFFKNDASPGMLVGLGDVTEDAVKEAAARWRQANQGSKAAHGTYFYSGDVSVHELGSNIGDLGIVPLREHTRNTIVQSFGLPPEQMGIIENSNRSTIDAATYLYTMRVLMPRIKQLWFSLQFELMSEFVGASRLVFSYESPVPEDKDFILEVGRVVPETRTVNEWRELQNLPPIPGGEVMYAPTTYSSGESDSEGDSEDE